MSEENNCRDRTTSNLSKEAIAAKSLVEALRERDDADLTSDMIEGETGLFEAIESALDEMRECDVVEAGVKEVILTLQKRASRTATRREKLRGLIEQAMAMAGIYSHKFPCETVTIKKTPPKLIITDESKIPSRFFDPQPPKLNKKDLFAAAKNGRVDGAEISNGGQTIQIRKA